MKILKAIYKVYEKICVVIITSLHAASKGPETSSPPIPARG